MLCPRCGLVNSPGITACARCGLPAPPSLRPDPPVRPGPGLGQPAYVPQVQPTQPYGPPYPAPGQQYDPVRPPSASLAPDRGPSTAGSGMVAMAAAACGALLCLGYAAWALTARRGIFADFSSGDPVSRDDARSSDLIDTWFLVVVGIAAVVPLVLWLVRRFRHQTSGGSFDLIGLAVSGLGVATVVVGLLLSGAVSGADGRAAQGDRGVTATVVIGIGFALLAIGLLLGLVALPSSESDAGGGRTTRPLSDPAGHPNW